MNCRFFALFVTVFTWGSGLSAIALPTSFDLVGRWDGAIDFGKVHFRLNLKIARSTDGQRLAVTMNIPDQGATDIPVPALLYHHPDIRIEIDAFNTSFLGALAEDGNAIVGQFLEGPGGRPTPVTFRRNLKGDAPEPVRSYASAAGEAADVRGYWKGQLETQPGTSMWIGLKVGRLPDGTFEAKLDDFERGTTEVPASSVGTTNGVTRMEWTMLRATFDGKLNGDGQELAGKWRQGAKSIPVAFKRLKAPATAFPDEISFLPDPQVLTDIRGDWHGTLDVGEQKLRIVFKLGQLPDKSYAGSMASIDQGGQPLLASSVGYTNPVIHVECKGIRGSYTGQLNAAGTEFDGRWEQGGPALPLKLRRGNMTPDASKNSPSGTQP